MIPVDGRPVPLARSGGVLRWVFVERDRNDAGSPDDPGDDLTARVRRKRRGGRVGAVVAAGGSVRGDGGIRRRAGGAGGLDIEVHDQCEICGIIPASNVRPMTWATMSRAGLSEKHDEGDLLRAVAEAVLQPLVETDVESFNGRLRDDWLL